MTEGSVTRAANALCMTQPAVSNAGAAARQPGRPAVRARRQRRHSHPARRRAVERAGRGAGPHARRARRRSLRPGPRHDGIQPVDVRLHRGHRAAAAVRAAGAVCRRRVPRPTRCWKSRNSWKRTAPTACSAPTSSEAQCLGHIRSRSLWLVEYACFMRHDHPLAGMKRLSTRAFLSARHVDVSLGGQTLPSYDMYLSARGLSRRGRAGQPLQRGL